MLGSQPSRTEDVLEDQAEEEDRDRDANERCDQAPVVEYQAILLRREEPERDTEKGREEHCRQRELHGRQEAMADFVGDRPVGRDARAEVLVPHGLHQVAPGARAAGRRDRIAGGRAPRPRASRSPSSASAGDPGSVACSPEEDEDRDAEQDRHEQQERTTRRSIRRRRPTCRATEPRRSRTARSPARSGLACIPSRSFGRQRLPELAWPEPSAAAARYRPACW